MHGIIHESIKKYVVTGFGEDVWNLALQESGLNNSHFMGFQSYPDEATMMIVGVLAKVTGMSSSHMLEKYGEYFYIYAVEKGFSSQLTSLGRNFVDFLNNLDYHHLFLSTYVAGQFQAPSFKCEETTEGTIFHYYSKRHGLYPLAIGLARTCAEQLFNEKVTIEVLKIETDETCINLLSFKEHVTMQITGLKKKPDAQIDDCVDNDVTLPLDVHDFSLLYPFHMAFNEQMTITSAGKHLENNYSEIKQKQRKINQIFNIVHPYIPFNWQHIISSTNQCFEIEMIKTKSSSINSFLVLKGSMTLLHSKTHILFLGSPKPRNVQLLLKMDVRLSDIPLHDAARDLILLSEHRNTEDELNKALEQTTNDLQQTSQKLEDEKRKTDELLYEMLPRSVADSLKDGKLIEAGFFESVTILFTDIVTFTVISSECEPIEVVSMLNMLFTKFDELCAKNDVYKVETIGDAYMASAGVPEQREDHALAVVTLGLQFVNACRNMLTPRGDSLEIRVGVHSGSAMAGVVGKKMPRYCLFGDTVNTASRMESHGLPMKVQISSSTYEFIKNVSDIIIIPRGNIKVKGKGNMKTYLVSGRNPSLLQEGATMETSICGVSRDRLLESLGCFFFQHLMETEFKHYLLALGHTLNDFINNIDYIHNFCSTHIIGPMQIPSIHSQQYGDQELLINYSSTKYEFFPFLQGILKKTAEVLFEDDIKLDLLEVRKYDNTKYQIQFVEHITIRANVRKIQQDRICLLPFHVTKHLQRNQQLSPFNLIFDQEMDILGIGSYFTRNYKDIQHMKVYDVFKIICPREVEFCWKNILCHINQTFQLELTENLRPSTQGYSQEVIVKGQMVLEGGDREIQFAGSPSVTSLSALCGMNARLSDITSYDARDVLLLNLKQQQAIDISQCLDEITIELKRTKTRLRLETQKTDMLLYELLPPSVAATLKQGKIAEAAFFQSVSILFCDIVAFAVIQSKCEPVDAVEMLNELFTVFDIMVETRADSYMACSGAPEQKIDHAVDVVNLGIDMIKACTGRLTPMKQDLKIRVGIHTGPVMTGVIGKRMPRYCLFGDTVTLAARLETQGIPLHVHVSQQTANCIKHFPCFNVKERGEINIKQKEPIRTFLVWENDNDRKCFGAKLSTALEGPSHDAISSQGQSRGKLGNKLNQNEQKRTARMCIVL